MGFAHQRLEAKKFAWTEAAREDLLILSTPNLIFVWCTRRRNSPIITRGKVKGQKCKNISVLLKKLING